MGRGLYNYSGNFRMHSWDIAHFLLDSIDRDCLDDAMKLCLRMDAAEANTLNKGYIGIVLGLTPSKFRARYKKSVKDHPDIPEQTIIATWILAVFHAERNARLLERFARDFGDHHPVVGYGYRDAHGYFMENLDRFNPWGTCIKSIELDYDNPFRRVSHSLDEREFVS